MNLNLDFNDVKHPIAVSFGPYISNRFRKSCFLWIHLSSLSLALALRKTPQVSDSLAWSHSMHRWKVWVK